MILKVGGARKLGPYGPEGPLSLVVAVVRSNGSLKSGRRVGLGGLGGVEHFPVNPGTPWR